MTDTRLAALEAVAYAAKAYAAMPIDHNLRVLRSAIDVLDALPAPQPVETVTLAVHVYPDGSVRHSVPGSQDDRYPSTATRLGTFTLEVKP